LFAAVSKLLQIGDMTQSEDQTILIASVGDVQHGWHDLKLRVSQLEAERAVLQQENKDLRTMLERMVEHRQKTHTELVNILSSLVTKLPMNDVGFTVSKLVEHGAHVTEGCAVLMKAKGEVALPQPALLKALDQTKRELVAAVKPLVEDLIKLDTPLEHTVLNALPTDPESFFTPKVVRANRCYVKGQLTRERVLREFGEEALPLFADLTTDPKLNPRPKADEIVLGFKPEFDSLLATAALSAEKKTALQALSQRVQKSKGGGEPARAQRNCFNKLSFVLELLHYYENSNTEAPDVIFAQRLPALIEQLVTSGGAEALEEKLIVQAEALLTHIVAPDHRLMVINNIGKGGGLGRTLKFVLRLRYEKVADLDELVPEFVKHLIPHKKAPTLAEVLPLFRLLHAEMLRPVCRGIMATDRIRKDEAEALGRALAKELGVKGLEEEMVHASSLAPDVERQLAWDNVKDLITKRADAGTIAGAIRDRLRARYDSDEVRQSWITLTEADPISLIRIICQLPYTQDGRTDPIARAVLESYVTRLTHEKYASTYAKVLNSLKNMCRANANSPTLQNFLAMIRWVDPAAAGKMSGEIGLAA
jgi:hypothetical protein